MREAPGDQGLYRTSDEHDACGVGFVAHIKGQRSHGIVRQALELLINLQHRGACGCEPNTGDGAGILVQMPDAFLRAVVPFDLPPAGALRRRPGLPAAPTRPPAPPCAASSSASPPKRASPCSAGATCRPTRSHRPLGRRGRPGLRAGLHRRGARRRPGCASSASCTSIRKRVEARRGGDGPPGRGTPDLLRRQPVGATRSIYKGMLTADQIEAMFPDLSDPRLESALALVHQRFSTNTFPSWPLAHPYRYIAHNGEINTLRGNINWMRAREGAAAVGRLRRRPAARCCRSSARAAATRPPSTTCSSSSSWPGARCRTRC